MYTIDYTSYRSVKGFGRRVRALVIHYTAVNFAGSVAALAGSGGVSAHYLVPDPTDPTYKQAGFDQLRVFNLVDEQERAWHAGQSAWASREEVVANFARYGYDTSSASTAEGLQRLIRAFQMHFRPGKYDGEQDAETLAILYALLEKYF